MDRRRDVSQEESKFPRFFIVGIPRSGTTLIRTMLRQHPQIEVPGETNFLPKLIRLQPLWWRGGRLHRETFVRLVHANGRLALNGLSRAELRDALGARHVESPQQAIDTIYTLLGNGKPMVGDKTPSHLTHAGALAHYFSESRFVHVLRHPLDVVSSLVLQPWGPGHAAAAARLWRSGVQAFDESGIDSGRVVTIRLEDLVLSPAATLTEVVRFLGLEFHPDMLEFAHGAEVVQNQNFYPVSHQGLSQSLHSSTRWRSGLDGRAAAQAWAEVEAVAHSKGYSAEGVTPRSARAVGLRVRAHHLRQSWRRARTVRNLLSRH